MPRASKTSSLEYAPDAIPEFGVRLSEAFFVVAEALYNNPEVPASSNEAMLSLLELSRARERKLFGFEEGEHEDHLFFINANLFFRERLRSGDLTALVRDPETGEVLKLRPVGWIPDEWLMPEGAIQTGLFSDYVRPGDRENPGPAGSLLRGALRPIFIRRDEFDAWMQATFGRGPNSSELSSNPTGSRLHVPKRQGAVEEAISALWGGAPPQGMPAKARDDKINRWLESNDRYVVSAATIRRALKSIRQR